MIKRIDKKKLAVITLSIIVVMQFFTIDKTQADTDPTKDFIAMTQPDEHVITMLKTACYNCHSNETTYPWYANIAPVSWWIKGHEEEAKEHLNFSVWGDYSLKQQDHKLEELYEEVEEGEMPLPSYTWVHADARLTGEQKEQLITWVKNLRVKINE